MDHLSDELRQLVDAARREPDPPPEVGARLWEAMRLHRAAASTSTGSTAPSLGVVPKLVLTAVVLGAGAGLAALVAGDDPAPSPRSAPAVQRTAPAPAAGSPTPATPVAPATATDPAPPPAPPAAPPSVSVRPSQPESGTKTRRRRRPAGDSVGPARRPTDGHQPVEPASTGGLAEESRLLTEAQRAMAADHPARALDLLTRHRVEFPRGQLLELRAVLEIEALCRVGRTGAAGRKRTAFLRMHSSSPFAARARRRCVSPGADDSSDETGSVDH